MAETTTAEAPKTEEKPILMTEEPKTPTPEKTLFKTAPTVEEAKAAAIAELAAAEAAKNAPPATESKVPTEKDPSAPNKAPVTTQTDYTLDLPENSALTKEDVEATLKEAKAAGVPLDKAKEMLQSKDQVAKAAQTRLEQKQIQDWENMKSGWKNEIKADPELGGEKLSETAIKSSRAFKAVATPALTEILLNSGYIDNPEVVRMFTKIYDLIGEDKFVRGSVGVQSTAPSTTEEKAKRLFGNPIKETV